MMLAVIATCLYMLAMTQVLPGLTSNEGIQSRRVMVLAVPALIVHLFLLNDLIFSGSGQNLSILNVASLISFIIAAIATLATVRLRAWFILPIVYCFAAINLCASTLLPGQFITHLEAHPGLLFHISLALFSYATLMIACLYAIQLAYLDSKLRNKKKLTINPNLPPLMSVERQLFKIVLVGYALLTTTLLSGAWFLGEMFVTGSLHKAVLSACAWVLYTVLLWGHYRRGWRGRPVVWFSVIGAFILTLAYFGSRFVKEVIIGG